MIAKECWFISNVEIRLWLFKEYFLMAMNKNFYAFIFATKSEQM
jgi:hypothetical protein